MTFAVVILTLAAATNAVRTTPPPELGPLAVRLVRAAPPSEKARVGAIVIEAVKTYRPSAINTVRAAMKAENRPPVTPGNEHGNRPEIPPGQDKYGSP